MINLFEAVGEVLNGALEQAPRFVIDRIADVEDAPAVLDASINNQFGHEATPEIHETHLGNTVIQSEVITPQTAVAKEPFLAEQSKEDARAAIDAIHDETELEDFEYPLAA